MLIFQYLNLIGSGLRRDAGCLEIGVCNLHKLAGAQTLQGCRVAEFIENDGVICDNVSSLTIDIIDVSGIEESIFRVDIGNPTDADDGGRLWRLLYGNKVGIGLWGNAPGKTWGEYHVDPHTFLDTAGADISSVSIQYYCVSIQVKPKVFNGHTSIILWDGVGHNHVPIVSVLAGYFLYKRVVDAHEISLLRYRSARIVIHIFYRCSFFSYDMQIWMICAENEWKWMLGLQKSV